MPLRVSALRALGAYMNVFALEGFVDEVCNATDADPLAFRRAHLDDPRARDVLDRAAHEFGWSTWTAQTTDKGSHHGRGLAYSRYKNLAAYCAIALDLRVNADSGDIHIGRVVAAVDSGQAVNPDGIRNQTEGGIVQSASWTLFEQVKFSRHAIDSVDWQTYPILRFESAPQQIDVHVIDRPGAPFLGTGEAAQGPMAAAIGNALADAIGVRLRELPLTAERVKTAMADRQATG